MVIFNHNPINEGISFQYQLNSLVTTSDKQKINLWFYAKKTETPN